MIYIDLDGVLADLDGWLEDKMPVNPTPKLAERAFNTIAVEQYEVMFTQSKRIEENFALLAGDYRILTALPHQQNFFKYGAQLGFDGQELARRYNQLYANKLHWCIKQGIPADRVIIVPARKLKQQFCINPEDTLYDDSLPTIREWRAKGGIGFVVGEAKDF